MPPAVAKKKKPRRQGRSAGGQQGPAFQAGAGEPRRNITIKPEKAQRYRDALAADLKEAAQRRRMSRFLTHARQFGYGRLFAREGVKRYFAGMGLNAKEARLLFATVAVKAGISPAHMVKIMESLLSHPHSSNTLKEIVTQKPLDHLVSFFRRVKQQVGKPRPR